MRAREGETEDRGGRAEGEGREKGEVMRRDGGQERQEEKKWNKGTVRVNKEKI